jgi:hypothetical protein
VRPTGESAPLASGLDLGGGTWLLMLEPGVPPGRGVSASADGGASTAVTTVARAMAGTLRAILNTDTSGKS